MLTGWARTVWMMIVSCSLGDICPGCTANKSTHIFKTYQFRSFPLYAEAGYTEYKSSVIPCIICTVGNEVTHGTAILKEMVFNDGVTFIYDDSRVKIRFSAQHLFIIRYPVSILVAPCSP